MEPPTYTGKPQSIKLTAFDALVSILNIQQVYFYENKDRSPDFMPADTLHTAFNKTISQFPPLLGHLRQQPDNSLSIIIDKDSLNLPEYRESTSTVHYNDIKACGFDYRAWPSDLMTVGENSGVAVFLSLSHAAGDGAGFHMFANRWVEEAKVLANGSVASDKQFTYDRELIQKFLPKDRKQLNEASAESFDRAIGAAPWQGTLYRVDTEKLGVLREELNRYVPEGVQLTKNDVISALIAKTVAQSVKATKVGRLQVLSNIGSWIAGKREFQRLMIPCDTRPRLGMGEINYSVESQTTLKSLAELAVEVRKSVGAVDAETAATEHDLMTSKANCYMNNVIMTPVVQKLVRPVSNADSTTILPDRPPSKAWLVSMTNTIEVLAEIKKNEFWCKYADFVY
ncbi:hypothetical protein DL89DRAFT_264748 [Linderina pennispora]|uniref:Transferase n=1 Tax=Linderina pennispora TaxID=61395 RepID=A0A1Y1WN30_9FUNG|nr:uncharacterized protein DL89DRAFT_264748 [Linderina pennispora]ORX74960.1 hypothetical protein DL89DRAFT_264748 [Linderina pennispora]